MEKSASQEQFPIFSAELPRMKRNVELLSRVTRTIDFRLLPYQQRMYVFEWFSQ